jgi:hypothetical protein
MSTPGGGQKNGGGGHPDMYTQPPFLHPRGVKMGGTLYKNCSVETEQFLSERAMGLEPTSRPWKGRVIAIIRRPHKFTLHIIANFQRKKRAKNKKNKLPVILSSAPFGAG